MRQATKRSSGNSIAAPIRSVRLEGFATRLTLWMAGAGAVLTVFAHQQALRLMILARQLGY